LSLGRASRSARDWALQKQARKSSNNQVIWDFDEAPAVIPKVIKAPIAAAE
jgi:multidrug efflux pump